LQSAIFNSANFSSIATDAKGVIQIFNVGAERMLGYTAADVMNKITPADISDPQEVIARAEGAEPRARHHRSRRASRRWCSRPRAASRTSTS
jgi:PAS domain S-box-containing protein